MMANEEARGYRAYEVLISYPMSFNATAINTEGPVPLSVLMSYPPPAAYRRDSNVTQESLYDRLNLGVPYLAFIRAILVTMRGPRPTVEDYSTAVTSKWYCFTSHFESTFLGGDRAASLLTVG